MPKVLTPSPETPAPTPAPDAVILPDIAGDGLTRPAAPHNTEATRPFILVFSGQYHSTPKGPRPTLFPQTLKGGIAGVRAVHNPATGGTRYEINGLLADLVDAGKIGLPLSLGYCVQEPGLVDVYRPVWGRFAGTRLIEDADAYDALLVRWMDEGIIPKPTAADLDALRDRDSRVLGQNVAEAVARFKVAADATAAAGAA